MFCFFDDIVYMFSNITHDFDFLFDRQLFLLVDVISVLGKPVFGPMRKRIRAKNVLPVSSWKTFYDIEKEPIGRGYAGKVYKVKCRVPPLNSEVTLRDYEQLNTNAYDTNSHSEEYACKVIRRWRCGKDTLHKIKQEISALRQLQYCPISWSKPEDCNILRDNKLAQPVTPPSSASPRLIAVHEDPLEVAVVMEYAHGGSLYELCRKVPKCYTDLSRPQISQEHVPNSSNPSCFTTNLSDSKTVAKMSRLSPQSIRCHLPPERYIAEVMRKVLQALNYMHQQLNLVHLDIKAENILLRQPYPSTDVFIIDFGLATVLTEGRQHRELAGTPDYVAPEIINYDPISFATDMWSVGVLTYFLLTGVSPFLASEKEMTMQNITHGAIEFPPELFEHRSSASVDFLRRLLIRKPEQRMTAEQCLKHEWLQTTYDAENTTPAWSFAENNVSSVERFKEADIDSGGKLAHLCVKPLELLSSIQSVPLKPTLFSKSDYEPSNMISKVAVNKLFNQQGDYFVRLGLVTELIPLRSVDLCKIQMYIQALFPTHSLPIHHVYMEPLQTEQTHVMSCGAPTGSRVPAQYRLRSLLSSKLLERSLSNRRGKSEISITVLPSRCPLMSRITDQSTSLLIHLKSCNYTSKNSPKPNHPRVKSSYGDHHTASLPQNSAMLHLSTADYSPFSLCSPHASCACVYEPSLDDPVTSVHFPFNCNMHSEPDTWHRQHHRLANVDSMGSQTQLPGHVDKMRTRLPGLELIIRLFCNLHAICRVVWRFPYLVIPSNLSTRPSN
ncbi:hypothetical protein EG68_06213 [Paragonimus skrjabini miyazakii]|uniref:Protein kinase domain-containing protein n=1 Tax=Paragonimus skrjabini miyazakii TaxID=59628 RepID=A0A8S9YV80_9TREM|nr:hypothetical protein EG68_06213 [Paragonimus skrjabini miyazakii]